MSTGSDMPGAIDFDDPIWWPWAPPADLRDPWDGKAGTQEEAQS